MKLDHTHSTGGDCLACDVSNLRSDCTAGSQGAKSIDRIEAALAIGFGDCSSDRAELIRQGALSGGAYIADGFIRIRVAIEALPDALELNPRDFRENGYLAKHITDLPQFAKDVVRALNHEEEDGTTLVHTLFDDAMAKAIDDGSIAIDYDAAERARKGSR